MIALGGGRGVFKLDNTPLSNTACAFTQNKNLQCHCGLKLAPGEGFLQTESRHTKPGHNHAPKQNKEAPLPPSLTQYNAKHK